MGVCFPGRKEGGSWGVMVFCRCAALRGAVQLLYKLRCGGTRHYFLSIYIHSSLPTSNSPLFQFPKQLKLRYNTYLTTTKRNETQSKQQQQNALPHHNPPKFVHRNNLRGNNRRRQTPSARAVCGEMGTVYAVYGELFE